MIFKPEPPEFILAAKNGNVERVKYLFETGLVDVNMKDDRGSTAFMVAAKFGRLECLEYLLAIGQVDVNRGDNFGFTALMNAAGNGHLGCLKFLLQSGLMDAIDGTNRTNDDGDTAFMCASAGGQIECVRYLLDTRLVVDIKQTDNLGKNAFILSSQHGHAECVEYFLHTALIDDVNKGDCDGNTALMLAAKNGFYDCVECLLQTRLVDVNQENASGLTALMCASRKGRTEFVKLILNTGLVDDVDKEDEHEETAFMKAVIAGNADCVKCLLDTGKVASLYKQNSGGETALMKAISLKRVDCLRCIFDIVLTDCTPNREYTSQDISSRALFVPNDSNTCLTYCPGITWKSPYVYDRDQQGQSTLKLVVGRGLSRCAVCLMLGDLDVPLTPHSVCCHEGLEHSRIDLHEDPEKMMHILAVNFADESLDYVLQYERIRFHILVVLLKEEFVRTSQISLVLYQKLRCLIWKPEQVDYFLGMLCDGIHLGQCVDFLLSAIIFQKDKRGRNALKEPEMFNRWNFVETLVQHVRVQDCQSLSDCVRDVFVNPPDVFTINGMLDRLNAFLTNGLFQWDWYPRFSGRPRDLARALVVNGYSPGEFQWQGVSSSPLHHALTTGDEGLARYLVANLYLTSRDLDHRRMDRELRKQVLGHESESLHRFHRQVFGSPWSLRDLSFVKVSTLLRCKVRRVDMVPVDSLPIPQALKSQLAFVNDFVLVD